ncbi:MAG TPA: TlpA disulfide reductase family protein [Caulobacteraceae bacterium]|jgi:thiol-disulfide isomerase/thioredoxin|nr:TlpA disulfide reductase family protein [Caulobacteraceae bacterium]
MAEMDPQAGGKTKRGLGLGLSLSIGAAVLIGAAAILYVIGGSAFKPAGAGSSMATLAVGPMKKLMDVSPAPPPAVRFSDADGKPVSLADFKGQVLVVNLWATWCGPCVAEMPTLAKLQGAYAGRPVKVLAISVDDAKSTDKAKAFIARHGPLAFYQNADLKLPFAFTPPAAEFPSTIIYDRKGLQRARMTGGADWASPEAHAVIDKLLGS